MMILSIISFFICINDAVAEEIPLELEKNQKFCGARLTSTLGYFCMDYNTPNRARRYIATECCQTPCTIKYMLENYCAKANPSSLAKARKFGERQKKAELAKNGTVTNDEKPKIRKKKSPRKRRERKCNCKRRKKSEREEQTIYEIPEGKKMQLLNRVVPSSRVGLVEHHAINPIIIFR